MTEGEMKGVNGEGENKKSVKSEKDKWENGSGGRKKLRG